MKTVNYLIFNDCCDFCSIVAGWTLWIVGTDLLMLWPVSRFQELATSTCLDITKKQVEKDVHFIKWRDLQCKNGIMIEQGYVAYSGGRAVAEVLATKNSLRFLSSISRNYFGGKFFDLLYYTLKKIRIFYNRLHGE